MNTIDEDLHSVVKTLESSMLVQKQKWVKNAIVLFNKCIVILESQWADDIDKAHKSHQDIKCSVV